MTLIKVQHNVQKALILCIIVFFVCFLPNTAVPQQRQLRIAILDTGLNLRDPRFTPVLCAKGHFDATGFGIDDEQSHGTHIAGLIKQYAGNSNYCLIIIKYTNGGIGAVPAYIKAMHWIEKIQPDVVNISGGDYMWLPEESQIIADNPQIAFIVAAGNEGRPILEYYPAALSTVLPNVIAVGASDYKRSNYGKDIVYEPGVDVYSTLPNGKYGVMTGTSQSTAIHTGRLIYAKSH